MYTTKVGAQTTGLNTTAGKVGVEEMYNRYDDEAQEVVEVDLFDDGDSSDDESAIPTFRMNYGHRRRAAFHTHIGMFSPSQEWC